MYDQIREDTLYIMLYAAVTIMALLASCYLLFRQGNAFASDIKTPARLRRWTATFFAFLALNHLWYMPIFFLSSSDAIKTVDLVGGLLDSMTFFPLAVVVLLTMLQDRRRPLWPAAVIMMPLIAGGLWCVVAHSYALQPVIYVYFLLACIGLIIYMVRATRQYGRWLRDNYADLEHKEVWQSLIVLGFMLLVFVIYASTSYGPVYQYAMQAVGVVLICFLLWRVETLSDLSMPVQLDRSQSTSDTLPAKNIGSLLKHYCEEPQLYLQHDLTLLQLARTIGTNRFYLSQYFSSQGMNYNAYINHLRVNHFISLYRDAAAAHRSVTSQQLALESGYSSYSTFRNAFIHMTGLSVTAWIKSQN